MTNVFADQKEPFRVKASPKVSEKGSPPQQKTPSQRWFRTGYCYKHGRYPRKDIWQNCPKCQKEPRLVGPRNKPREEPDLNITMRFSRKLSPEITFPFLEMEE